MRALGAADPVALGVDDLADPGVLQLVQAVVQLLGVGRGAEVPLGQLALGDLGAAALAGAVGQHLLVGQHGLVLRAPVDRAVLAVGQPLLAELQEQPLGPLVVLGVGRVQPARPVEGQAVLLHRRRLGLDVGVGVGRRVLVVADGRVLGGQAERVPAHRVQHLEAAEAPVARDHVVQREHLGVTHVQVAAGVGEHRQRVLALLGRRVVGPEGVELLPDRQPLVLDRLHVVRRGDLGVVRALGGHLLGHRSAPARVVCCWSGHEKTPRMEGWPRDLSVIEGDQRGCPRSRVLGAHGDHASASGLRSSRGFGLSVAHRGHRAARGSGHAVRSGDAPGHPGPACRRRRPGAGLPPLAGPGARRLRRRRRLLRHLRFPHRRPPARGAAPDREASGSARFWARRAKRLLPSSLLVLLVRDGGDARWSPRRAPAGASSTRWSARSSTCRTGCSPASPSTT